VCNRTLKIPGFFLSAIFLGVISLFYTFPNNGKIVIAFAIGLPHKIMANFKAESATLFDANSDTYQIP